MSARRQKEEKIFGCEVQQLINKTFHARIPGHVKKIDRAAFENKPHDDGTDPKPECD